MSSSALPSPDDDYAANGDPYLNKAFWDAALTSIGARLRAIEAVKADWEELISLGTGQALAVIQANIEPQLVQLTAVIDHLKAEVALAQDAIAAITVGSVPATAVYETAGRIWLTPALRDAWNAKQPGDQTLSALAALDTSADKLIYATGVDTFALATITAFARGVLASDSSVAFRTAIAAAGAEETSTALGAKASTALVSTKSSRRNRHLNPAFQVGQYRDAEATVAAASSVYVMDGIGVGVTGGGVLTCSQAAKLTPGGSLYRTRAAVTTADAAIAAGDAYYIVAKIEGVDVADLKFGTAEAQPFVWRGIVNFPAGTYGLSFANAARNRSYVTTFTISAEQAGTDVLVTAVVPGCTDGVWLRSNSGVGINVSIALAIGTTGRTATTGAWVAGEYYTTAAQTNGMASTANVFELADIGLYAGTELPAWELPDYAAELQRCLRYYERISIGAGAINAWAGTSGNNDTRHFPFKVPKRVTPSTSLAIEVNTCTAAVTITTDLVRVTATATASGLYWWRHNAEYFVADARL